MKTREEQKNIVLIGPLPPPIGGVSIHVSRYSKRNNIIVFPESKIRTFKSTMDIMFIKNSKIFVHSESWYISLILIIKHWILNQNCIYLYINHNFHTTTSLLVNFRQKIYQRFRYCFIRLCSHVYVVNPELIPKMRAIYGNINISLFDPFVPPDDNNEDQLMKELEPDVADFLLNHRPIILSGAWQLSFHNNEDLYGFDMLIELIYHLKLKFPAIGLIFFIGNPEYNKVYLENKRTRINDLELGKSILLITGQKEMWPLLKRSSLFIRATNTDGDSISIKEALHYGINVIASDCTLRAAGVKLFKSRNLSSLISTTLDILEETDQ